MVARDGLLADVRGQLGLLGQPCGAGRELRGAADDGVSRRHVHPPFSSKTGKGYKARIKGDYDDAQFVKGNEVVVFVFETSAACCPHGFSFLRKQARLAKDAPGFRDGTKYSTNRIGARSWLTHNIQRIAIAITNANATHINGRVTSLKMRACHTA